MRFWNAPPDSIELCQHWFRWWLGPLWCQAITWSMLTLHQWGSVAFNLNGTVQYIDHQNLFENKRFQSTATYPRGQGVNSLWPSDTIWWHRSRSTLAQVMACCLTAPSHYLNQWWLIISEVQCNLLRVIWQDIIPTTNHWNYRENFLSKIFFNHLKGQWVKALWHFMRPSGYDWQC